MAGRCEEANEVKEADGLTWLKLNPMDIYVRKFLVSHNQP